MSSLQEFIFIFIYYSDNFALITPFSAYLSNIFLNKNAEYAHTTIKLVRIILKFITGYFFFSLGFILNICTIGLDTPVYRSKYIAKVPSSNPMNI